MKSDEKRGWMEEDDGGSVEEECVALGDNYPIR